MRPHGGPARRTENIASFWVCAAVGAVALAMAIAVPSASRARKLAK